MQLRVCPCVAYLFFRYHGTSLRTANRTLARDSEPTLANSRTPRFDREGNPMRHANTLTLWLIAAGALILSPTAFGDLLTLHPSDVSSSGGFSVAGGIWSDSLDTNDTDASYAHYCCSGPGQIFYVDMDDPVGLAGATIESVRISVYSRYVAGLWPSPAPAIGAVNIGYRTGTDTVWVGDTDTDMSGAYNLIQSIAYTTDSDLGPLDLADLDSLQISVQRNASGSLQLRTTEIFAEIIYSVVPEPSTLLLFGCGLAALSAGRRLRGDSSP